MRVSITENQIWFGPIRQNLLDRLDTEPQMTDHGVAARASTDSVEIFATWPYSVDRVRRLQNWYLQNHFLFER